MSEDRVRIVDAKRKLVHLVLGSPAEGQAIDEFSDFAHGIHTRIVHNAEKSSDGPFGRIAELFVSMGTRDYAKGTWVLGLQMNEAGYQAAVDAMIDVDAVRDEFIKNPVTGIDLPLIGQKSAKAQLIQGEKRMTQVDGKKLADALAKELRNREQAEAAASKAAEAIGEKMAAKFAEVIDKAVETALDKVLAEREAEEEALKTAREHPMMGLFNDDAQAARKSAMQPWPVVGSGRQVH